MAGRPRWVGTNSVGWLSIVSAFPVKAPDAAHRYYITDQEFQFQRIKSFSFAEAETETALD